MLLKQEEIEDLLGTMFSGELIPTLWSSQYLLQQDSMWRQNLYDKKKKQLCFCTRTMFCIHRGYGICDVNTKITRKDSTTFNNSAVEIKMQWMSGSLHWSDTVLSPYNYLCYLWQKTAFMSVIPDQCFVFRDWL